jgi:hypothetical protein
MVLVSVARSNPMKRSGNRTFKNRSLVPLDAQSDGDSLVRSVRGRRWYKKEIIACLRRCTFWTMLAFQVDRARILYIGHSPSQSVTLRTRNARFHQGGGITPSWYDIVLDCDDILCPMRSDSHDTAAREAWYALAQHTYRTLDTIF